MWRASAPGTSARTAARDVACAAGGVSGCRWAASLAVRAARRWRASAAAATPRQSFVLRDHTDSRRSRLLAALVAGSRHRVHGAGAGGRIRGKPLAGAAATPKAAPLCVVYLVGGFGGTPPPPIPSKSSGESLRSPFPGDNGILVACSFLRVSSGDGSSGGGVGCGSRAANDGLISSTASFSGPGAEGSSRRFEGIGVPASMPAVGLRCGDSYP